MFSQTTADVWTWVGPTDIPFSPLLNDGSSGQDCGLPVYTIYYIDDLGDAQQDFTNTVDDSDPANPFLSISSNSELDVTGIPVEYYVIGQLGGVHGTAQSNSLFVTVRNSCENTSILTESSITSGISAIFDDISTVDRYIPFYKDQISVDYGDGSGYDLCSLSQWYEFLDSAGNTFPADLAYIDFNTFYIIVQTSNPIYANSITQATLRVYLS